MQLKISVDGTKASVVIPHSGPDQVVPVRASLTGSGVVYLNKVNPLRKGSNLRPCLEVLPAGGFAVRTCFSGNPDVIESKPGEHTLWVSVGNNKPVPLGFRFDGSVIKAPSEKPKATSK